MDAQSGVVTVVGSNSCGNGTPAPDFPVTVNPIPDSPVITGLESMSPSGFTVYPVPNSGLFTIKMVATTADRFNVSVFNSLGSEIYEERNVEVHGGLEHVIDLRPVEPGVYTIIIDNTREWIIRKIVVK